MKAMNDRLRKLMVDAISNTYNDNDITDKALQKELDRMYIPNLFVERFTELVLRDCFNILSGYRCDNEGTDNTEPTWEIKKHFGL